MMQMNFTRTFHAFLSDERGAELAEYAVAVALLVAIALIVYKTLGNAINDQNSGTGAKVLESTTFTP
jgi:Flp pilus assembly pilin Flp